MNDPALKSVASDYAHYEKSIEPRASITLRSSSLKWYSIAREDQPVEADVERLARAFIPAESTAGRMHELGEYGFVLLHRCNDGFYFLLVNSWRNNNELWESIYAKDSPQHAGFRQFASRGLHRATFCVWELTAVCHEQQAWARYLLAKRDGQGKQNYLQDLYRGKA